MIPASFECESVGAASEWDHFDFGKATTRAKRRITPALRGSPETSQNEPQWALVLRGNGYLLRLKYGGRVRIVANKQ